MKEPEKKTYRESITSVNAERVRQVLALYESGYSYRTIAKFTGLTQNKVFKIVNGYYRVVQPQRCKECGAKLKSKTGICGACKIKKNYGAIEPEKEEEQEEEFQITLELKPKDYERYLKVRKKKLEQIDREAEAEERFQRKKGWR